MDTHSALAGDLSGVPESPVVGDSSRALLARRTRYPKGHHIQPHWHSRAQFLFAVEGTMRVRTPRHVWIVPPSRALWLPARTTSSRRSGVTSSTTQEAGMPAAAASFR